MLRLVRVASFLSLASATACSLLFDSSGLIGIASDAGGTSAMADVTSEPTTPPLDASSILDVLTAPDTALPRKLPLGIPTDCEVLVEDTFAGSKADSRWSLLQSAKVASGEVVLTEAQLQVAGGLTMATPTARSFTRVFARFVFHYVVGDQGGADGMTFFWSSNANFTLGDPGGDLAICGGAQRDGSALAINTLYNRIGLWDLADCTNSRSMIDVAPFNVSQAVVIDVANGEVSAKVGAATFQKTIGAVAAVKRVGFTASTGGASGRHAISDVGIYVCP